MYMGLTCSHRQYVGSLGSSGCDVRSGIGRCVGEGSRFCEVVTPSLLTPGTLL